MLNRVRIQVDQDVDAVTDLQPYVACQACHERFLSPIQIDPAAFEVEDLSSETYQCPHCGTQSVFDKKHHCFDSE